MRARSSCLRPRPLWQLNGRNSTNRVNYSRSETLPPQTNGTVQHIRLGVVSSSAAVFAFVN